MTHPQNEPRNVIPDDPEQSRYRFVIVAGRRARQLQGGARPLLATVSKKSTIIAMEEVSRGLIAYELLSPIPEIVPLVTTAD
jgi:DNA-directed RNA polymerase subunit omega